MSWGRIFRYWTFKLKRLQGSPYAIACGFACGAAVSFTPFIGFHFILAAVLAWAMRGNIIASAIGTAVGNPWTFPFIWAGIMWIGTWILGYERGQELPAELTFGAIFEQPGTVLLPMLVGSLPTGVIVWLLIYFPVRRVVGNYQHHRQARRLRRRRVLDEQRRSKEDRSQQAEDDITIPETASQDGEPVAANVTHLDQVYVDRGR
ncbi:MAG: DUF2062 domain-containing protein [Rhodospirillales bacterium]|nr:DUF2062 domain-containing protein [Rhodospirillales bacterium]